MNQKLAGVLRIPRVGLAMAVSLVCVVSACDETGAETDLALEGDGFSLSTLLHAESEVGPGGRVLVPDDDVERWMATVDKELTYARALEANWNEQVRAAVTAASDARARADGAQGAAREAAVAEAREILDAVPWTAWTTTLIACVDDRITEDDLAQARDSRSGRDPAWQARVRRADRLKNGAGESMREENARRSLQRAFYACEMASQLTGVSLGPR